MAFLYSYRQNNTSKKNRHNFKNHKEKTFKLIYFTFLMDINISARELKTLSKYKDLEIEGERMWQLKTSIILIAVGVLGLVKKETAKHLEKIPGKLNLAEIQKIVLTSAVLSI